MIKDSRNRENKILEYDETLRLEKITTFEFQEEIHLQNGILLPEEQFFQVSTIWQSSQSKNPMGIIK